MNHNALALALDRWERDLILSVVPRFGVSVRRRAGTFNDERTSQKGLRMLRTLERLRNGSTVVPGIECDHLPDLRSFLVSHLLRPTYKQRY